MVGKTEKKAGGFDRRPRDQELPWSAHILWTISFFSSLSKIWRVDELDCSKEPLHESKVAYGPLYQSKTCLPREIHGAPPGSFVVRLSEIMGSIRCLQKMGLFWMTVIAEKEEVISSSHLQLRRFWSEGLPVPLLPLDETPDLNFCLLHQHLQVVNCCIARKRRRFEAITSLQCTMENLNADSDNLVVSSSTVCSNSSTLFARLSNGNLILRLGSAHPSQDLTLLESGEPMYSPVMQAANPGCILEDFVRWHSPPDWIECESNSSTGNTSDGEGKCKQGQLSIRMKKEAVPVRLIPETKKQGNMQKNSREREKRGQEEPELVARDANFCCQSATIDHSSEEDKKNQS
ncbi:hypothetical protein EJ110_NYTH20974 [Nymphaea thermarum]|nr:hypothetical protein EJ110_NYTH20974 [Nymphaea thermarum]